jgi:hypothetical protein
VFVASSVFSSAQIVAKMHSATGCSICGVHQGLFFSDLYVAGGMRRSEIGAMSMTYTYSSADYAILKDADLVLSNFVIQDTLEFSLQYVHKRHDPLPPTLIKV